MPSNFAAGILWPGVAGTLWRATPALKPISYLITGVTRDSSGAALGSVILYAYESVTPIQNEPKTRLVNMTTSDATSGAYSMEVHSQPGCQFVLSAYKAGSPDVTGATVNTLTPTPT